MDKLAMMIVLFLLLSIASSKELKNTTVHYGTASLSTGNLSKDLAFTTVVEHPGVQTREKSKPPEEASRNSELHTMTFTNHRESVINFIRSKISSNETQDENASFVKTNDPLNAPSQNVLVHSSVQGDNAMETSTSVSNQSFIFDSDKTVIQNNYSYNVNLEENETSTISESSENEGVQEYVTQTFTPSEHFELGNESLTAISPNSRSSLSTVGVEPPTRVHNSLSNYPVTVSEEEKFSPINHSIRSSTTLPSENNEDHLFTKLLNDREIIRTHDTTANHTSPATKNIKSRLMNKNVREITTDTDFTITPGSNLIDTSTGVLNQSLIPDKDQTASLSIHSSNDDLAVNETSAVAVEIEGGQENITQTFTPSEYFELGNDSLTTISPNSNSSLSTVGVKPPTRVHNNFSNYPVTTSKDEKFNPVNHPITSSTPLSSKNIEDYLFTNLSGDDEIIRTDDTTPNSPSSTFENSETYLVDKTDREITTEYFELGNDSLTAMISSNSNSSLSTVGVELATRVHKSFSNFTTENNHDTSLNNPQEKVISELLTKDKKEINSAHPTIHESSVIYEANVESHSIENATENNNTNYLVNITDIDTILENSTIDVSSKGLDKHAAHTSMIPEVLFSEILTDSTSHHQDNSEKVLLESTSNSSNQNILEYVPENDASLRLKESLKVYKLILTGNCSDALPSHKMPSITEILNRKLNAQNSTELVRCLNVYEFNFTSNNVSRRSFDKAVRIIQETINPDLEATIVNYTFIVNNDSPNQHDESENFVIPKIVVYILSGVIIAIFIIMMFVIFCLWRKFKNNSDSVDLSYMPHVASNIDDYKVAPIPRPSISYPETNRGFLHAYSNETYNRTPDEYIVESHFSNGNGKETVESKLQKEKSVILDMETFNKKGGAKGKRPKSTSDIRNASAGNWDRLRDKGVIKRQSQDNFAIHW